MVYLLILKFLVPVHMLDSLWQTFSEHTECTPAK